MAWQFDIKNQSFRQIMGNGLKYRVPKFQRDYSWKKDHWHDLWWDIHEILREADPPASSGKASKDSLPKRSGLRPVHYMGYLVLKSSDNKNFDVIDGQQRLTTISLLILAALKKLRTTAKPNSQEAGENKQRLDTLQNSFIGFKNPVTLEVENKLTLNINNEACFRDALSRLKPPHVKGIKASDKLMIKALEYFDKALDGYFKESKADGAGIAKFIESTADQLLFTSITVGDETNAYSVFETLNARGVQLSTPDLVKNYIFSLIDPQGKTPNTALTQLEERWSALNQNLGKNKFSDFIQADWNSRNPSARKKEFVSANKRTSGKQPAGGGIFGSFAGECRNLLRPEESG